MSETVSLYDQLTDQGKEIIEKKLKEFEATWEPIVKILKEKDQSLSLPLCYAMTIHREFYDMHPFDLTEYIQIFDPKY